MVMCASRVRMPVLQILEVVQRLFAVEHPDVLRLSWGKLSDSPRQMHEVRFHRRMHRVHSNLARQTVRLPRVAWTAGSNDVRPLVGSTARQRNEMVASE